MEDLLIACLQLLFEFVFDGLGESMPDLIDALWSLLRDSRATGSTTCGLWWGNCSVMGTGLGFLTLILHPDSVLRSSGGRLACLLLAPAASAGLVALLAGIGLGNPRSREDLRQPVLCTYLFTLSLALVRFTYAHH